MKAVLVIADGMADRPLKTLNWKTPLEVARKPSLNHIAKTGICGTIDPITPGTPPGSDTATLALLGYDVYKTYSGRGAFEAIGSGITISKGDVAFRCNFATINEKQIVIDRRAGRIANEEAKKLALSLQKAKLETSSAKFLFKNTVEHRAVLVLSGAKLSAAVSDSDPEQTGEKVSQVKPLEETAEAKSTAKILNELLNKFGEILKKHPVNEDRVKRKLPPANFILCRGAGTIPNIKTLPELYNIKAACIAAVPLIRGVCKVAGMKLINVKGATGTIQTDFAAKAKAAVQALKTNDFVLLHVKATDVASHDRDAKLKISLIEKVDSMIGYILDNVDLETTYLAVTADHTTSTLTGKHEGDPVPIAIAGYGVRSDDVDKFDERSCAKGGLDRIEGKSLMPIIMGLMGKTRKFGA